MTTDDTSTTAAGPVLSEGLGLAPERGLLARLRSLKVLLGTDSPEVRGWAPVVQQGAQATANAAIAALTDLNAMSERLEQTALKLAEENERLRTAVRTAREGYASEAATGLPVLPQWRERALALIDEALRPNVRTKREKTR